jgi:hypothetical protein
MKGVAGVTAVVVFLVGTAATVIGVTAAASAQPLPVAYGFDGASGWQHGQVRPHDIYFGAGGSLLVRGLTWSNWAQGSAVAHGVRWADDCTPTCAAGTYAKSRATLTLSAVLVHAGLRYFSKLTLQWTANDRKHETVFHWSSGAIKGTLFWS